MKYLYPLILLPYEESRIYSMADSNSNTFPDKSKSDTELPDFNTLNPFDMEPRERDSNKK